jgi:hypothetical protein
MPIMGAVRFQQFFRAAAEVDVDRNDLKRYSDFVNDKIYDMLIMARVCAKSNNRDIIQPTDLPVTKGLQTSMHQFRELDHEIDVVPLLERLTARPPLDVALSDELTEYLPKVAGGLSLALARTLKVIEPEVKAAHTELWERAFRIFELLL